MTAVRVLGGEEGGPTSPISSRKEWARVHVTSSQSLLLREPLPGPEGPHARPGHQAFPHIPLLLEKASLCSAVTAPCIPGALVHV